MPKLTDVQNTILKAFFDLQMTDEGYFNDDETPLMLYSRLEEKTGIKKAYLQIEVRELRNMGILWLAQAVDQDYVPSGSGWCLTDPKGVDIVRELFFT
ncbi:MAG: hypothetical protein V4478_03245 [Patescibacteria group bacterium]